MINKILLTKKIKKKNKNITKKNIIIIINNLIKFIKISLKKKKKIKIKNFGYFNIYKKNIQTNFKFFLKKKKNNIIYFKCSKKIILKIN